MRHRGVRHSRHEKHVDRSTGWCACIVPHFVVGLLSRDLLFVELPVIVDGDGFRAVHEGLDVWEERFPSGGYVAMDILTSVYEIVLVLHTGQSTVVILKVVRVDVP